MSRSGYSDDMDDLWGFICYRGAVSSAINGKRGQMFLQELLADLDAMPEKRLVAYDIVRADGACCALGCVAKARGVDVADLNPTEDEIYDGETYKTTELAKRLGIAPSMAREIVFTNDEAWGGRETSPEQRWEIVRAWVLKNIRKSSEDAPHA